MTTIPTMVITPAQAAGAYQRGTGLAETATGDAGSFGGAIRQALQDAVGSGKAAETQATAAISGEGNLTDVVMAVSKAELALQTASAVRDRVLQAYQDIMRMPI